MNDKIPEHYIGKFTKFFLEMRDVVRYEGVLNLISRGSIFLLRRIFWIDNYYLIYEETHRVPEDKEENYIPKVENYCSKLLTTNQDADKLLAEGFSFGAYELNLRASLDKNVISFCLFVNKEFAHVSCMADNPRGKAIVDPRPFNVDYKNGEVVVGKALTVPKFRRLHLQAYNGYIFRKYCRECGIKRVIASVNSHSIPALGEMHGDVDRHTKSKCRLIRVLGFKYVKESKIENTTLREIVAKMIRDPKKH